MAILGPSGADPESVPAVRVKSVFAEAGLYGALGGPKCAAPVLRVRSWCGQYEGLHAVPGAEPKLDAPLGISPADTPQTLSYRQTTLAAWIEGSLAVGHAGAKN
jgi:hypothetical protein